MTAAFGPDFVGNGIGNVNDYGDGPAATASQAATTAVPFRSSRNRFRLRNRSGPDFVGNGIGNVNDYGDGTATTTAARQAATPTVSSRSPRTRFRPRNRSRSRPPAVPAPVFVNVIAPAPVRFKDNP
jgi:hypothetical protein